MRFVKIRFWASCQQHGSYPETGLWEIKGQDLGPIDGDSEPILRAERLKCLGRTNFLFADGIFRKACPEHWSFTLRLLFGRFILYDVPMLDKDSVLNA